MNGNGVKIFTCKDKSSCNKDKCSLCWKYDKCKNCIYEPTCHWKDNSPIRLVPKCYRVLY